MRMSDFAASPLVVYQTARMRSSASSFTHSRAPSRPIPEFAPVVRTVWSLRLVLGGIWRWTDEDLAIEET
jgi:hypothetical protein